MKKKLPISKYSLVLLIFIICLVWTSSSIAQNRLSINLDAAQFQNSEQQSYLEIYYSIPEAAAKYVENTNKSFDCKILTSIQIYQSDSLWVSKIWKIEQNVADSSQLTTKQFVDLLRYPIDKSGHYKVVLTARDLNRPENIDSTILVFDLQIPDQETVGLSDLEFASNIQKAGPNSQSEFTKYTYEVIPNPSNLYGEKATELYYYYETYNLMKNIPGKRYKIMSKIQEFNGDVLEGLTPLYRNKIKRYDFGVEFGKMNVSKLKSGRYLFTYGICDSSEILLVSKQKEFYIYNSTIDQALPNITKINRRLTFLDEATLEDLDLEFDKINYLVSRDQKKIYKNLSNLDAKRKLLYSIWKVAKPEIETTTTQFREKYLERVELANIRFKSAFKAGWKTDQGRVFVLYGPPDNIERNPSTVSSKPYQIWQYEHLQGGVIFVFVDRIGLNKYELVHSTLRGELQEPNWQRLISTTIDMY